MVILVPFLHQKERTSDSRSHSLVDWASRFWNAYLDAKHPRGQSTGVALQLALAETARDALVAELLNSASGVRRAAGEVWLSSWRAKRSADNYRSLCLSL